MQPYIIHQVDKQQIILSAHPTELSPHSCTEFRIFLMC